MAESFVERRKRELGLTGEKQGRMSFVERRKIELGLSPSTPEYQEERKRIVRENFEKAKTLQNITPSNMLKLAEEGIKRQEAEKQAPRIPSVSITAPSKGTFDPRDVVLAEVYGDKAAKERLKGTAWETMPEERRREIMREIRPIYTQEYKEEQYAKAPEIIRDIGRGLDKLARITKPLAELYTPGAGPTNVASALRGAGALISRAFPGLIRTSVGRAAQTGLAEAAVGGVVGAGQALTHTADEREALEGAAVGAATGGVLGAAGRGISEILGRYLSKAKNQETIRRILELPAPRQRGRANVAETPDIIVMQETSPRGLPEPSVRLAQIYRNVDEAEKEISNINDELKHLDTSYQQAINDQYQLLKQQMRERRGVTRGALLRDEEGNVIGRIGRTSENPQWYRDFFAEHGRAPNNRELYELAKRHVDNGYHDDGLFIPSWREQNNYDEVVNALTSVRDELQQFVRSKREFPALDLTVGERIGRKPGVPPTIPRETRPVAASELVQTTATTPAQETSESVIKNLAKGVQAVETTFPQQPPESVQPLRGHWFTELFGDFGVGISPLGSRKRIRDVPLTTADQIVSSPLKREGGAVEAAMRAAYQNFVDYLRPLKDIDETTYLKALDSSRANNIANAIITDKLVTPEGNVIGEGLENIFRKVARGRSRDFVDYLVLRHAATRMARGEQVYDPALNMTVEKVQELIRRHEQLNPGLAEIAREFDQFMDRLLYHYGVEEGLISPQLYQTLRERNPNYVPMRRQFSFGEKLKAGKFAASPSGFSGQKAPIKKVSPTGSARRIVDPRRSVIEQVGAWVNAAMRNRVMQQIVDVVKRDPEAFKGIIEIVQKPKGQPNLGKILYEGGVEGFLEELDTDFVQLFKKTRLDKDNIVRAMVNGQPVYLQVKNPEVLKALIGMAPDQANFVMRAFEALSNATKRGATGVLAPMFAIRTLTADLAQALIQSRNPATHLWDFGHALISSLADAILPRNAQFGQSLRALAQEYRRVGGIYSAVLRGEQHLQRGVSRMNRYPILSPQYIMQLVGRTVSLPFRALEGLANVSENVNRMAAFRSEMRRLGGDRTPENVRRAMQAAREITVNWSRRGLQSRNIEKVVPYNNAAIQGLYRFARAWRRNPIKTTAMVMAGVMAPKFYEYMTFHDDPDYQMLPAREKYMNLIVAKNPDGTFVKIKMPYEYAALGAFMVDSLEAVRDQNQQAFKGAADALANSFTPPLVSGALQGATQGGGIEQSLSGMAQATVLGPGVSILSNRNYAGVPIEPMALQDRSPQYRYDERTSSVAKELGQILGFSPKKIDYIIRSYGGDPARLLLPLTSDVGGGRIKETLLRNFIVDPVFTNNLQNDFYTAKERLTQAKRDNTEVGAPLPKWYSEELYRLVTSRAKGSLTSRIEALQDQKTQIQLDRSIPVTERSMRLREVQRQINELLIDVNTRLYESGVPMR